MEYTKQAWTAPTGTGLSRYAKSAESASHVTLTLDPENLTNTPTPFTMARMAHMEDGIAKAYDTAPPTPWAQYSGKDIPQLPDNLAGTTYKRDNDWTTNDGWGAGHPSITLSVEDETLKLSYDGTRPDSGITFYKSISADGKFIKGHIKCTVPIINVQYHNGTAYVSLTLATPNAYETDFYGYIPTSGTNIILAVNATQLAAKTCWLSQLYIGDGSYDRLVFDNSYHYRHLLNNAVIPTPQGLYFNGCTSYLRSKEKITLPDVFTFSATVNCALRSTTGMICYFRGNSDAEGLLATYRVANSDSLGFLYYNTNTNSTDVLTIGANLFAGYENKDVNIKTEIDFINKKVSVFRENVFIHEVSVPYLLYPSVLVNWFVGINYNYTSPLLGYMRNIQLYDTALTDTQRNWLAQGNTPPILYDVTNYNLGNTVLSPNDSRVKTALNTSTPAPIYACRAWVRFNGTNVVSIAGGGNISSVTDNGTGKYTVNFTIIMSSDSFGAVATTGIGGETNPGIAYIVQHLINAVKIETGTVDLGTTSGAILKDYAYNSVAIFSY